MAGRKQVWAVVLLLAAFVAAGWWNFVVRLDVDGDDLSSSYMGCRLLAEGQQSHLYAHDAKNFAAIGPDLPWQRVADEGGYVAFLHPYVQTPLWGYSLLPLCEHLKWRGFEQVFALLAMLSFAGAVWVVARHWTPRLLRPMPMAVVLVLVWVSTPFQYSMQLMQTHVFFVLAMLGALMLADRGRPATAGLLLAVAATVKITPGVLVVYWLLRRQWRAALSAAVWSAVLWAVTRTVAGPALMAAYAATLNRVSHTLLLSMNNQSLAAWWMDLFLDLKFDSFKPLPLPSGVRLVGSGLLVVSAALGGWLDWRRHATAVVEAGAPDVAGRPLWVPVGGLVAIVGATIFAPLEWTHYSIVLIAPVMVLAQYALVRRVVWPWVVMTAVLLLNVPPLALDPFARSVPALALVRGHFYAEVVCLGALVWLALKNNRSDGVKLVQPVGQP